MKKVFCFLMATLIVLGLCACGESGTASGGESSTASGGEAAEEAAASGLQVGFGRESMMPRGSCWLGGGGEGRVSEGFSDMSYITCVAITEGEETILLYTADIISPSEKFLPATESAITEATGVPAERILFAATHTHSGVGINYTWDGVEDYRREFAKAAAKAGAAAMEDRASAEVWSGSTQTEKMTFVRHYLNEDGSFFGSNFGNAGTIKGHAYDADTELQVVKFARAAEDKKDVVLMSFPTHGTFNESGNTLSADFPAPCREYIEANSDSLVAYFMGTAGDQTPSSRIAGEAFSKDYKVYGEKLGQYVLDTLPNLTKADGNGIKFQSETYSFNSNKEGMDKLAQAQEVMQAEKANGRSHPTTKALIQDYGFASFWDAKYTISRSKLGDTLWKTIYTMEIGGISLIVAPYEMFSVHGRHVKENSPYDMTFIITCCEDSGYIPTEEAFGYRSYEAQVTSYAKGTGEALAENFVQLLTQMKTSE